MGWNEILRSFNIPGDGMLQRWIEQYRKFGTCVDNRGKATHLDNPSKVCHIHQTFLHFLS